MKAFFLVDIVAVNSATVVLISEKVVIVTEAKTCCWNIKSVKSSCWQESVLQI